MNIDKITVNFMFNDHNQFLYNLYKDNYIDIIGITFDNFKQRLITDYENLFNDNILNYDKWNWLTIGNTYNFSGNNVMFFGCIKFTEDELKICKKPIIFNVVFDAFNAFAPENIVFCFKQLDWTTGNILVLSLRELLIWVNIKNANR